MITINPTMTALMKLPEGATLTCFNPQTNPRPWILLLKLAGLRVRRYFHISSRNTTKRQRANQQHMPNNTSVDVVISMFDSSYVCVICFVHSLGMIQIDTDLH